MPDLVAVMGASLDDPSWFRPGMDVFTASALPWARLDPDLPKFPDMPQMRI